MYKLEHINCEYNRPQIDCKYQHLTEKEIEFLYKDDKSLSSKILLSNCFKKEHNDLKEFERQINNKFLEENKYNDSFPCWYIFRLVEHERITINLEVLLSLELSRINFLNTNSRLINVEFMRTFEEIATNKLEYSKGYLEKHITISFIKAIIYLNATDDNLVNKLYEYKTELDNKVNLDLVKKRQRQLLVPIATILREMGYEIDIEIFRKRQFVAKDILETLNPGLKNAINLYMKTLETINNNYLKQQKSHIRVFFIFLSKEHGQIDNIEEIKNLHITEFVRSQKDSINIQGKKNENVTINERVRAVDRMLNYLKSTGKYNIAENIITRYDLLRETESFQRYVSENEIAKLIYTILNAEEDERYEQHKAVLTILVDTGRRIHEVLTLNYNCYKDGQVFFHKTKKNEPNWQYVGEATRDAIMILKKYASKITTPIYSNYDGLTIRRLVPSKGHKARAIISEGTITKYFKDLQLRYDILNEDGTIKYKLHDLKKVFKSSLTNAGISPELAARFLDQDINNLVPYEISNALAISTLKKVEGKGLLTGKGYRIKKTEKESFILNILKDVDVVRRNTMNLISKINNPSESLPLFLGNCVDVDSYKICGDLVCVACDEFVTDSFLDFCKYAEKMYTYIYSYKRNVKVKEIEEKLIKALRKCYLNIESVEQDGFNKVIIQIKKKAREDVEYEERK